MKSNKTKGIFFIISAAFCFAVMNLLAKMSGDLPSIQKAFFRNAIAFWFALAMIIKKKPKFNKNKTVIGSLFLRSLFGTLGIVCNFYAVDKLLFADAGMLTKMSPFFAVIFSIFILKERASIQQMLIIFGAFIGMTIALRPSFHNLNFVPSMVGLFGGIFAGAAYTYVRKLGKYGVDGSIIVLSFTSFSLITLFPIVALKFEPMTFKETFMLILAGLAGTGGQFSVTKAYTYASAKEISIYDYSQIIFSGILGFIFLHQVPDIFCIIGYTIIIVMAFIMYIYNNRKSTQSNRELRVES